MKLFKPFIPFILFLPLFCSAENISLNFKNLSVSAFAQATFKDMLHRDFVLSPDVTKLDKEITVSIKSISLVQLPALVERVLAQNQISIVQQDNVFYLSLLALDRYDIGSMPSGSNNVLNNKTLSASPPDLASAEILSSSVFTPIFRKSSFVTDILNAVFKSKPATSAGSSVVLLASDDELKKMLVLCSKIDSEPSKVKISATFVEVSNSDSKSLGLSVVASFLGSSLGINIGESSHGSLQLKGKNFQVVLDALASDGRFKQVSNPSALSDDGERINLNFGDSVPTVSGTSLDKNGNALQQIQYQQSGVLLSVLPSVLSTGKINLVVDGQVSSFSNTTSGVTSSPTLTKRQVQTAVTLDDNEILIIGGLSNEKSSDSNSGFSFLPTSWSTNSNSKSKTDLVLIITASLIK